MNKKLNTIFFYIALVWPLIADDGYKMPPKAIVDIVDAKIVLKSTGDYSDYSLSLSEYISADGRILYAPQDVIYEIKYPNLDIKGTIR